MIMRALWGLIALLPLLLPGPSFGAQVKPLEVVTEKILVLETERLGGEHAMNAALVRRALERLDKQMNIMSQERIGESLKLLADARSATAAAERSAAGLSSYVQQVRDSLKEKGHVRYLPLARLHDEIEKPYHVALDRFLATATDFVQYCNDNLEAIATGQAAENKRYDQYYIAYLREMEVFNAQSMKRSQQLADWSGEYPALLEFLPR
jgi:hypothetical protein